MKPIKTESERRQIVAIIAQSATGKAKAGIALIDFRQPSPAELATGERLSKQRKGR